MSYAEHLNNAVEADSKLPHADAIAKLLAEGKKDEAAALHNAHVEQQLEAAKQGPINLSDLMAGKEAFVLDEIKR